MYFREETEYYRAKLKAARRVFGPDVRPADLPSNREIREQIEAVARAFEGEKRVQKLGEMRLEALRMMRLLKEFRPRLVGSTLTGHVRRGSDIDIHVFSDSVEAVRLTLEHAGLPHEVIRKRVVKHGEERTFTHIRVTGQFEFELTVYPTELVNYRFKSSITGKAMERASIEELEKLLAREHPQLMVEIEPDDMETVVDRFRVYESLLLPLEKVKEDPRYHPEGDVLYHSLQVFERAREESPYDEEFLLAALLHDVGKAIDPKDHVKAGLEALEGFITERTAWLIEHHMEAQGILDGTIGARARRRLETSEDFDTLILLAKCDRAGRRVGVKVPELEEVFEYLRSLERDFQ
ncbi:MAG: HD domain-containing protein [Synergistales bacterium]|nr:HD domain-containing protein [Synergistales bacterium]